MTSMTEIANQLHLEGFSPGRVAGGRLTRDRRRVTP